MESEGDTSTLRIAEYSKPVEIFCCTSKRTFCKGTNKRELMFNQDFFHSEFSRAEPDPAKNPGAATTQLSSKLRDTGLLIRMMHDNRKSFLNAFWDQFFETQLKHLDLFILLKKKACKLVRKFFKKFPILIHRCDEDGSDPLLYVCLKVRGCRHRLVKFLIEMGCDFQRRNSKGENFLDVLRLQEKSTTDGKLN